MILQNPDNEMISKDIISISQSLRILSFVDFNSLIDLNASFDVNLLTLLRIEQQRRFDLRFGKRIKAANFPVVKTIDSFEMNKEYLPNLKFEEINEIMTCDFISKHENIVAIGQPGRGKTHLALAVGYEAAKKGFKVLFKQADALITEMAEAKTDSVLTAYIDKLQKVDLLIIDELGYLTYGREEANLLFRVVTGRYETRSTFFTTNCEFSKWKDFFTDSEVIIAMVDRLIHHTYVLDMTGPKGYRITNSRIKKSKSLL